MATESDVPCQGIVLPPDSPRKRKTLLFSAPERAVLKRSKAEYMTLTTHVARHQLLRSKILPELFNYYEAQGDTNMAENVMQERISVST